MDDVRAERMRQVNAEGWTPEHDDEHTDGSLALAAIVYADPTSARTDRHTDYRDDGRSAGETILVPLVSYVPALWPPNWAGWWYKPKTRRQNLVRAAALLVAEIERLDRSSQSAKAGKQ